MLETLQQPDNNLLTREELDRSLLTEKENRFADLVADGFSDQEIADQMYVASTTVRNVLSRIYKKLDIEGRNRLSAMVWQDRPGWVCSRLVRSELNSAEVTNVGVINVWQRR